MEYKIGKEAHCAVIGYGSWATAIAGLLSRNESDVWWYIRNPEVLEGVISDGRNPKYVSDFEFDLDRIHPSADINEVVRNAGIIIMAAPSAYLKDFLEPLTEPLNDKFIVSAIKGIIPGEYQTVAEYLKDRYNLSFRQIGIIGGPSHAEEVSKGRLSYLTVVCTDEDNAHLIGEKLSNQTVRLSYSADIYGVEYASILKNIYAIAVGISVGLGYGDNFRAVLISNCSREMREFLNVSYPYTRDTNISAYLGDLLVTCYSTLSRNRRLGLLIGKGCSVKSALNEMTMIAEGYFASDCIRHINLRHKAFMPIADTVHDILYNGKSARKAMASLEKYLE